MFPWSRHRLLVERTPVRVSRIGDLPPDAQGEREGWRQLPIRSALTLPIETGGVVRHLIALNTVHQEREWPDVFVTRLRVLGEMLVSALDRQAMVDGLREAEERVRASEARLASAADWPPRVLQGNMPRRDPRGRAVLRPLRDSTSPSAGPRAQTFFLEHIIRTCSRAC
jgi:GAF domain-containing protein